MSWSVARKTVPCKIKGETVYKVTDVIDVKIAEVRMETRSVISVRSPDSRRQRSRYRGPLIFPALSDIVPFFLVFLTIYRR